MYDLVVGCDEEDANDTSIRFHFHIFLGICWQSSDTCKPLRCNYDIITILLFKELGERKDHKLIHYAAEFLFSIH